MSTNGTSTAIEPMAPGSTMKRPTIRDEAIRRKAAETLAEECATWAKEGKPDDWVGPLLKTHDWMNGYQLAKELERIALVSPDAELVEILDMAYSHLTSACDEAVRTWVRIVGFEPQHAEGDVVSCRHGSGPVHSVEADMARYVVDVERRGNGGYLINAEDVSAVAA